MLFQLVKLTHVHTHNFHPGNVVIGYEMSAYNTTEEQGIVELCVVVTNPQAGAPDVITVSASTRGNTAGNTGMHVHLMYIYKYVLRMYKYSCCVPHVTTCSCRS